MKIQHPIKEALKLGLLLKSLAILPPSVHPSQVLIYMVLTLDMELDPFHHQRLLILVMPHLMHTPLRTHMLHELRLNRHVHLMNHKEDNLWNPNLLIQTRIFLPRLCLGHTRHLSHSSVRQRSGLRLPKLRHTLHLQRNHLLPLILACTNQKELRRA